MMWLRRVLLVVAILLCAVLAVGLTAYYRYRETPSWYQAPPLSEQERKQAANSADQKLADLFSWAAAVQAHAARQIHGDSNQPTPDPKSVTLSETELNAFVDAWQSTQRTQLQDKLSHYFTDGKLVLTDNRIILAGTSRDLGAVLGVQLDPSVDDQGHMHLQWDGISAGELNLPRALVSGRLKSLNAQLQDQMSRYQESADIDQTLTANSSAVQASLTRWLLDALNGKVSDSTAFVPFDVGDFSQAEAVRLTSVQVTGGSITLGFTALAPDDRAAILSRIKQPYSSSSDSEVSK
jgi:hypothetical protein